MAIGSTTSSSIAAPTVTAPTTTNVADASDPTGGLGADAFMKLLVAQLKNQDPNSPSDPKDMVTQLSQLTGVQRLVDLTDRVQALEATSMGMASTQASDLIGKPIVADGTHMRLNDQGSVDATFTIASPAKSITVTITDSSGKVVRTAQMDATPAGTRTFTWDGREDNGMRAPSDRYSISYSAVDDAGHPIPVTTDVSGVVSSVSYDNGYPELVVGAARVMLGDVHSIG